MAWCSDRGAGACYSDRGAGGCVFVQTGAWGFGSVCVSASRGCCALAAAPPALARRRPPTGTPPTYPSRPPPQGLPQFEHHRAKTDRESTTMLSPWIHAGSISVRHVYYRVAQVRLVLASLGPPVGVCCASGGRGGGGGPRAGACCVRAGCGGLHCAVCRPIGGWLGRGLKRSRGAIRAHPILPRRFSRARPPARRSTPSGRRPAPSAAPAASTLCSSWATGSTAGGGAQKLWSLRGRRRRLFFRCFGALYLDDRSEADFAPSFILPLLVASCLCCPNQTPPPDPQPRPISTCNPPPHPSRPPPHPPGTSPSTSPS